MITFCASVIPAQLWDKYRGAWKLDERETYSRFSFPLSLEDTGENISVADAQTEARTMQVTLLAYRSRWREEVAWFIVPATKEDMALLALWDEKRRLLPRRGHDTDMGHEDCENCELAKDEEMVQIIFEELNRQHDSRGMLGYFGSQDEKNRLCTIQGRINLLQLAQRIRGRGVS